MKRSEALAGLSRDHHEALAVALRLRRADATTADEARERFAEYFERRGAEHFDLEESVLGPAIVALPGGQELHERLLAEHEHLRALGASVIQGASVAVLHEFGGDLTAHVRFEERELFPLLEAHLDEDQLTALGTALADEPTE
jgi:hemerythrin-like domain-containing protein